MDKNELITIMGYCSKGNCSNKCPYIGENTDQCRVHLIGDAREALRDDKPKGLKLEDLHEGDMVWLETLYGDEGYMKFVKFSYPNLYQFKGFEVIRELQGNNYERRWRCWRSEPSAAERDADWKE